MKPGQRIIFGKNVGTKARKGDFGIILSRIRNSETYFRVRVLDATTKRVKGVTDATRSEIRAI